MHACIYVDTLHSYIKHPFNSTQKVFFKFPGTARRDNNILESQLTT